MGLGLGQGLGLGLVSRFKTRNSPDFWIEIVVPASPFYPRRDKIREKVMVRVRVRVKVRVRVS